MAIIPRFERQKLASSIVGTPGIDTSGAQIAESVAGVANKGLQVLGQQAIQKHEIQKAAEANKTLVDVDVELEKAYIQHQKDYKTNPKDKTQFFKDNAERILQTFADGTEDPEVRSTVERIGYGRIGEKVTNEIQWADKQATQNTIDTATTANETLANEAYIAGINNNVSRALDVFTLAEDNIAASKLALGEKDSEQFRKNVQQGYISGLMEQHPAELKAALDRGDFKKVLTPEETRKLKDDAVAAVKGMKEKQDMNYFVGNISQNQQSYEKYIAGTLTYAETQQIPDEKFGNTLNELRIKGIPFSAAEQFAEGMDLYGEVMDVAKGKSTLEQVVKLQSKILSKVQQNQVSREAASSMLKQLVKPASSKLDHADDFYGFFNKMSAPYKRAYNGVREDAKRHNLSPSTQLSVLVEFDQELAKLNEENPNSAQVDQAYDTAYKNVIRKTNPSLLKSTEVTNAVGNKQIGVTPIYTGSTKVIADRTVKPVAPIPVYTEEEWAASAKKRGITVDEAKKRAGAGTPKTEE